MIIVTGRKLLVPSGERHIGFTGDNLVESRIFAIYDKPLFDMEFRIDIQNTGETVMLEKRLSDDGSILFLKWDITAAVLKNLPALKYQLRAFEVQGERIWHSETGFFNISPSVDAQREITEVELSEFQELEKSACLYRNEAQQFSQNAADDASRAMEYSVQAQTFRNQAESFAQQSIDGYGGLLEKVYTKDEVDSKIAEFDIEKGISENSLQQDGGNIAGCKGYHITAISEKVSGDDGLYRIDYTLDTDEALAYSVGDVCTIRLDNNYDNCGEIESINGNVVTVKIYSTASHLLPTTLYSQTLGDTNSFRVPLKPDIGNIDIGGYAAAFGSGNYATGAFSFASGCENQSIGKYSHTEGLGNVAVYAAHGEGKNNKALGCQSHVEGMGNVSQGINEHIEGSRNVGKGDNGHIEGVGNTVKTSCNHVEGENNVINNGTHSHVQGKGNTVENGAYSHLEGTGNKTTTWYAHLEGRDNSNTHSTVHIEGMGNKSTCNMQHIQGKYNATAGCSNMAHIVGGGTSDSDRKNIHTLDWNGNAWFDGTGEFDAVILRSSTTGSSKKFKLTVDDSGTLSVTAV